MRVTEREPFMRSPILRAILIFVGVTIISWLTARLLVLLLPANRTSLSATLQILASGVLTIGGPIIGLFLALGHCRRNMRHPIQPPPLPTFESRAQRRRRRTTLFVAISIPTGISLLLLFGGMVIPAAWLAGGGDMPAGHGNPSDMQAGTIILYVIIGMAAVGAILLVTSLVAGIGLLLTREKRQN